MAACAATQLFAQNSKQGVITFSLASRTQVSVSTSKSANNAGLWSQIPTQYKTTTGKVNTWNVIQAISYVLHKGNPNFYSSKAQLVLVQSELGGFFNITDELAKDTLAVAGQQGQYNVTPDFTSTLVGQGGSFARLATGRHIEAVPVGPNATPYLTTGFWPVGHHQPWGQIFIKDYDTKGNVTWCVNVTFFFAISVEECYDCYYLSSFVSDASFKFSTPTGSGPPCCSPPESLTGSGVDRYYMKLSFDNTDNNPYLNKNCAAAWIGWGQLDPTQANYNPYAGIVGVTANALVADGTTPDLLPYVDSIKSGIGRPLPYEMRFALEGIVTYSWTLKYINKNDVAADFIGTANYAAYGYGFIALTCQLLSPGGLVSASIAEKAIAIAKCCMDEPWYGTWPTSWYGIGFNQAQDPWDQFGANNNLVPNGFESPINTPADLSFHAGFDEEYEPGEQFNTNPTPLGLRPTLAAKNPQVFTPVGP